MLDFRQSRGYDLVRCGQPRPGYTFGISARGIREARRSDADERIGAARRQPLKLPSPGRSPARVRSSTSGALCGLRQARRTRAPGSLVVAGGGALSPIREDR